MSGTDDRNCCTANANAPHTQLRWTGSSSLSSLIDMKYCFSHLINQPFVPPECQEAAAWCRAACPNIRFHARRPRLHTHPLQQEPKIFPTHQPTRHRSARRKHRRTNQPTLASPSSNNSHKISRSKIQSLTSYQHSREDIVLFISLVICLPPACLASPCLLYDMVSQSNTKEAKRNKQEAGMRGEKQVCVKHQSTTQPSQPKAATLEVSRLARMTHARCFQKTMRVPPLADKSGGVCSFGVRTLEDLLKPDHPFPFLFFFT